MTTSAPSRTRSPNELFPTEIRGSAVGLASSLSRIGAAIGTYLVPAALSHISIGSPVRDRQQPAL
jgi:hypothetical protein